MSASKIHIFSKNTHAVASIRGYEYQKLKTLESWLENGLARNSEEIYCEYEEDIFQRNLTTQTSKFRQVKLYSSVFSFSSEEVQKALVHFFSLFSKADYLFDNVQFAFEASSRIAREQAGNDGQILKDWSEQQDNLTPELLKKCIEICQRIIGAFYEREFKAAEEGGRLTNEIESGYYEFKKLENDYWTSFVKTVRWKFDNVTPDQAVENSILQIEELILKQPKHNVKRESIKTVLAYLLYQVTVKSTAVEPNNRMLDLRLLETCLLEQGSKMDVWYSELYSTYYTPVAITTFSIGEFYEILSAAQYCRNHSKLYPHAEIWFALLLQYYSLNGVAQYHQKRAVYEIVWLRLKPNYDDFQFEGTLEDIEDKVQFFIGTIDQLESKDEFEQMLNVLNIIFGLTSLGKSPFAPGDIISHILIYSKRIDKRLGEERDINNICYLLEYKGLLNFSFFYPTKRILIDEAVKPFYEILAMAEEAQRFNVSELAYRINQFNAKCIQLPENEINQALIAEYEKLLDKIRPVLSSRSGKFAEAKYFIERGMPYVSSNNRKGLFKAIEYFHKARELYQADETMEGYVLAVLNISQFYTVVGLNFAAKYYALTGLWVCMNNESGKYLHRISRAFQFLYAADYSQGAWMSAIADFNHFVIAFLEFPSKEFGDESLTIMLAELGLLISCTNEMRPDLNTQFEFLKNSWPPEVKREVVELGSEWGANIKSSGEMWTLLSHRCIDSPFNDLGNERSVSWNALGSTWTIVFDNSAEGNSIGEEFAAIIQIMLGEISLSWVDFHLIQANVVVHVKCGAEYSKPEQRTTNEGLIYDLTVKKVEGKEPAHILGHAQRIGANLLYIFGDISLLPDEEIHVQYKAMIEEHGLLQKIFTLNAYHRMYDALFSKSIFDRDQRRNYERPIAQVTFPREAKVMEWRTDISLRYNSAEALKWISNRYDAAEKICGPTIRKHINEMPFIRMVQMARGEGWLDWQILLAIFNYVVDSKVKAQLRDEDFSTEQEYLDAMQRTNKEVLKLADDELPMLFPAEAFSMVHLKIYLEMLPTIVGRTWGLEIRHSVPNTEAIRKMLNKRFNFNVDDIQERSPFQGIK